MILALYVFQVAPLFVAAEPFPQDVIIPAPLSVQMDWLIPVLNALPMDFVLIILIPDAVFVLKFYHFVIFSAVYPVLV